MKYIQVGGVSCYQDFLIGDLRLRRPFRYKSQVEVIDDAVDHGMIGEEGDDLHLAVASRADRRVDLKDLLDRLGPVLSQETSEIVLQHPEMESLQAHLPNLPPTGVGAETVVAD